MKKNLLVALSIASLSWSQAQAHSQKEPVQSCVDAYHKTGKAYNNAAKWIGLAGMSSPVSGPLLMALGPLYYAGKELKDLGTIIAGDKDESRAKALAHALIKNPGHALASFGGGILVTAFGIPAAAIATPVILKKGHNYKKLGDAFEELADMDASILHEESKLPKHLHSLYHYMNKDTMHTNIPGIYQGDMEKSTFVSTLQSLVANHALCPQGAVYHIKDIRTIVKGFAYDKHYRIPKAIYEKTDWYQSPLRLYIRHHDNFKPKSVESRMAVAQAVPSVRHLYEGRSHHHSDNDALQDDASQQTTQQDAAQQDDTNPEQDVTSAE